MAVTTMRSSTSEHTRISLLSQLPYNVPSNPNIPLPPLSLSSTGYASGNLHTRTEGEREREFHKRFSSSSTLGTAAGAHLWPFAVCAVTGVTEATRGYDLGEA